MSSLIIIYIILCCVAAAMLSLYYILYLLPSFSLRERYTSQITTLLITQRECGISPKANTPQRRMALAEAIYIVMTHTYYNDISPLRKIVEKSHLENFLWRRIRLYNGTYRARLLLLTSAIPLRKITAEMLSTHLRSKDDDIRISALTSMLAATPTTAIHTIAQMEFPLSPFDLARIIALLRRGILPIAYEPLLSSENRNLRMLGLSIVRNFGIESAERRLHQIISTERDTEIITHTLYTLASLGRSLSHTRIRERLASMTATKRMELCRHLCIEGYSLGSVKTLFNDSEVNYAERVINSFKRQLGRNTVIT